MKLVRSMDLTVYDLPRIESPFLAAGKVRQLLAGPVSALQLPHDSTHHPYGRNGYPGSLEKQVRNGELLLVHGPVDGMPVSPVVTWQTGEHLPGGGRWTVNTPIVGAFLENDVAKLNEWAVTPEQLRNSHPMGIGGFPSRTFGTEMQIRRNAERRQSQPSGEKALTMPLGGSASVMPLAATSGAATENSTSKQLPGIHLEVGIFTDGTLNNAVNSQAFSRQLEEECLAPYENGSISEEECERRLGLMLGGSYTNAPSNVAKLWRLYSEEDSDVDGSSVQRYRIYVPGVGSKTGSGDSLYSAATGMGARGVVQQVKEAFSRLARETKIKLKGEPIRRLTIDLFGFSRGAAAARHAANEINLGQEGGLAEVLLENGVAWPEEVSIRFVGLFDTVAGIANVAVGDLAPDNDRNDPVKLYLDPGLTGHAVHLTAIHEYRKNFALNSLRNLEGTLPDNFREIALPGAHSDIGGGYSDKQREEVLVSPLLPVPSERLRWPEKTIQWDSLEDLRKNMVEEGWIGPHSLPVEQSDKLYAKPGDLGPEGEARLEIVKNRQDHPVPDGTVELGLRMVRRVRSDYSTVVMRLMHHLAVDKGVPLREIGTSKEDVPLPEELDPIWDQLVTQVARGENAPSLTREQHNLLLQRYIHYSASYNSIETLIGRLPFRVRLFRHLRPHAPASSRERLVYPQQEGK